MAARQISVPLWCAGLRQGVANNRHAIISLLTPVVHLDRPLAHIPNLAHFLLTVRKFFFAVWPLKLKGNGAQELHSLVVEFLLIEDTANVINSLGSQSAVQVWNHVVSHKVNNQQIVVQGFQTFFRESRFRLSTHFTHQNQEIYVWEDSEAFTFNQGLTSKYLVLSFSVPSHVLDVR